MPRDCPLRIFFLLGAQQGLAIPEIIKGLEPGRNLVLREPSQQTLTYHPIPLEEWILPARGNRIQAWRDSRRIIQGLRALRAEYAYLQLYLPHAYHGISNFAAFSLRADEVALLPDGALNYVDTAVVTSWRRKMIVKKLAMLCCGVRYHLYEGSLTGANRINFSRNYTLGGQFLRTAYGEVVELSNPMKLGPAGEATLFIDQPLDAYEKEIQQRVRVALSAYLADRQILYKAHPTQTVPSVDLTILNATELPATSPIEALVGGMEVKEIVSIGSSALLAIKAANPGTPCTAIGITELARINGDWRRLREVMTATGIRCT